MQIFARFRFRCSKQLSTRVWAGPIISLQVAGNVDSAGSLVHLRCCRERRERKQQDRTVGLGWRRCCATDALQPMCRSSLNRWNRQPSNDFDDTDSSPQSVTAAMQLKLSADWQHTTESTEKQCIRGNGQERAATLPRKLTSACVIQLIAELSGQQQRAVRTQSACGMDTHPPACMHASRPPHAHHP